MSLGLVVFSNINYYLFNYLFNYLFIYDVILTAFRIILSTWLYNYVVYCAGIMHDYSAGVIIKVSKSLQNSVYVGALTMLWGRLFHSLITEGKKENLELSTLVSRVHNIVMGESVQLSIYPVQTHCVKFLFD